MFKKTALLSVLTATVLMSGCASLDNMMPTPTVAQDTQEVYIVSGIVVRAKKVKVDGNHKTVATVAGGAAGAVVGNQFGSGIGKTIMTVAGGAAGAFVGNELDNVDGQTLTVKLNNGKTVMITQAIKDKTTFKVDDTVNVTFDRKGQALEVYPKD